LDRPAEHIECIVRPTAGPKPVAEPEEVFLVEAFSTAAVALWTILSSRAATTSGRCRLPVVTAVPPDEPAHAKAKLIARLAKTGALIYRTLAKAEDFPLFGLAGRAAASGASVSGR
jgi:hypothetical protein